MYTSLCGKFTAICVCHTLTQQHHVQLILSQLCGAHQDLIAKYWETEIW